jgi:TonB family protein
MTMHRRALWVLVGWISAAAFARAPRFVDQTVPGAQHEEGEARWTDSLARNASDSCADTSFVGQMKTGRPPDRKPREDAADCVRNSVVVRNDSPRPIQCRMSLELKTPDEGDNIHREAEMVIFPGVQETAADSYGPAALQAKSFSTKCVIVPASLLPEAAIPEGCKVEISGPSPGDFYPPGAKRRNEEGRVVLEYSVAEGSNKPVDVLLVGSSGFQDLDNAALKFAKRIQVKNSCVERRHRLNVAFKFRDS